MNRIINELKESREAMIYNIKSIYYHLANLVNYQKGSYGVALDDLYLDHYFEELYQGLWGSEILTKETSGLMKLFDLNWKNYLQSKPYGEDGIFVYFDPEWRGIIQDFLIPVLHGLEMDMQTSGIDYPKRLHDQELNIRPSEEEILERGNTLYNLLLKHKIVGKRNS